MRNIQRTLDQYVPSGKDQKWVCIAFTFVGGPPKVNESETAVIELKYNQEPPVWMNSLMLDLAQHRVRFSKYRASVQPAYWNCVAYSSE